MVRSVVDIKLLSLLQISGHCRSAQDHAAVALAANWRNKGKQVKYDPDPDIIILYLLIIFAGEGRKDRDSASGVASCCQWWWSCCCCHCSGSFYLNNVVKHAQVLHNIFKSPAPGKNRSYQNVKIPSLFIELMDQDCQILIPTFSLFSKISQTNPSEEVLLRFQS